MIIPPTTETAKFSRQQALEEIHSNFMKTYKEANNKINDRTEGGEGERRSKAYQKIVSNAQPSYMDEAMAKRQCVSEMFMDTSKFSTKTLSAINGLEGAVIRKNKEYNWRKEMENFEKRAEYERDVRARNVTALHRNEVNEDATPKVVPRRKEKEEKSEVKSTVKSWRERREAAKASQPAEPEPERKSWREKLAEKQAKDEEEQKQREADAAAAAKVAAEAKQKAEAAGEAETSAAPAGDQPAAPQEEDDASGTKKLKSDFNFMMSGLDAEFEAGRSKLAKLRERIRKAKAAIKEADDAMAEDERLRQEAIAAKKAARAQQQA
jgi:hypothetical protein